MTGIPFGSMLVGLLIVLLPLSLIGGLIQPAYAKRIGEISTANFGNSFLVCLIASLINILTWSMIGTEDVISMDFPRIVIINIVFSSISYIIIGKLIWKCQWIQSVEANILWIIAYAIIITFSLSNVSKIITFINDQIPDTQKSFEISESDVTGMWSYIDNNTVPRIEYFVNLRANGTYSMLDFGGDGTVSGKWEQKGDIINFYDDKLNDIWTQGFYSNGTLSIRTEMGKIIYVKK